MRMLEELRSKEDEIKTIGRRQQAEARSSNVSFYYTDPSIGPGVVEERPDGTKVLHDQFVMTKPGAPQT